MFWRGLFSANQQKPLRLLPVVLIFFSLLIAVKLMDPSRPETFDAIIAGKTEEVPDVFTLRLKAADGRKFNFNAGQFAMLCFKDEPDPKLRCRAYSVSSSQNQRDCIDLTIKRYREWTTRMTSLPVGSVVELKFPFGKFCLDGSQDDIVFIAGGVGVTPFMGMVRFLAETKSARKARLLYSCRTSWSIIFKKEFDRIAREWPNLKLVYTISDEDREDNEWTGRRGFIDKAFLQNELGDVSGKVFYVCGPNPMIKAVGEALTGLGAGRDRILTENFG